MWFIWHFYEVNQRVGVKIDWRIDQAEAGIHLTIAKLQEVIELEWPQKARTGILRGMSQSLDFDSE